MTPLSKLRGAGYLTATAIGFALVSAGWAEYNPTTGMVDIAPFNLYVALGVGGTVVGAPLTAFIALLRRWGH